MPGYGLGGGMSSRSLPDIKTRVKVDDSALTKAHANAARFGATTKGAMKDAKAATLDTERAMGQLESRMGRLGGAAGGLSGMFTGGLTPATAGLGLALAAVVLGGKSMLDITEEQQSAERNLQQAVAEHNASLQVEGRVSADTTRQRRALEVATNNAKLAQMGYTDAVRKHGPHSEQAIRAATHLRDANIGVANAQDNLRAVQARNTVGAQTQAISYDALRAKADQFIQSNRHYISDQSEVISGYGKLVRSGLSVTETQRVMNDAVDLAALKHISLTQAVDVLNAAEHGRMRGLIDLGITTKQLTDDNGNLLKGQAAVADAMKDVDAKVAHGRDTLTDYQKHVNDLNNDWQDLSRKGGPVIMTLLDTIVKGLSDAYDWFDRIGKDNNLWGAISDRLVKIAQWLHDYVIKPIQDADAALRHLTGDDRRAPGSAYGRQQHGGSMSMVPGSVYTVGEGGKSETVVMSGRGGYVIPNDAGGGNGGGGQGAGGITVVVNVSSPADPYDIANEVGWELRKLRRFG